MNKDRSIRQLEKDNYENLSISEQEGLTLLTKAIKELSEFLNTVSPIQHKDALDLLLKNFGWYNRMWMSFNDLVPYIKDGDEAVDNYFMKKLWRSKYWIKQKSIKRFPHRKRAIQLAFKAHNRREYELSVPAFLILSEGIFREMSTTDIFSKRQKEKSDFINKLKGNIDALPLLTHLVEAGINGDIIGLSFSNEEYLKYPNVLNRNVIIHGADYEYGTRINSYKAISQFEFIIEFVYAAVYGNF